MNWIETTYIGNDRSVNVDFEEITIEELKNKVQFLEDRGCHSFYIEDEFGKLIFKITGPAKARHTRRNGGILQKAFLWKNLRPTERIR